MTPQELIELLEYIKENNSWLNMYDNCMRGNLVYKYVSFQFDTRDCKIWYIKFRQANEEHEFRTERGYDLKEKVYEFLNKKRKVEL